MSKIVGGPEKKAFNKDGVIPINFSSSDPFWDIGARCNNLDSDCRFGKIKNLIIITQDDDGVSYIWRGVDRLTTILGMIEFTKDMLLHDNK